jgi:hypothetical protein
VALVSEVSSLKLDQDREKMAEQRIGVERRQFSYTACIPERRSGIDRRKEKEPLQNVYDLLMD